MAEKEKLIVILGPTAVGKTALSLDLAAKLQTEIISGDSMLIYKGLNIGTAKPSPEELAQVKHHMVDILEPDENYNVTDFQKQVAPIISKLNQQGKIPILAGGTGLYIKALLEGYVFSQQGEDTAYRQELENLAATKGKEYLYEQLVAKDPITAKNIHPNNLRRVIRALETIHLGKESLSKTKDFDNTNSLVYDVKVVGLNRERSELYDRINQRVDLMIKDGLIAEVEGLVAQGGNESWQSLAGIGYKEILKYLNSRSTLEESIVELKQNTRHFAKRQITWFKKMPYIKWFNMSEYDGLPAEQLLKDVLDYISEENYNDK